MQQIIKSVSMNPNYSSTVPVLADKPIGESELPGMKGYSLKPENAKSEPKSLREILQKMGLIQQE